MYNYIPHPSNCRISSSLLHMRMREGVAGYGIYWMLLEILRDSPNYRTFYFPESFAFSINCPDVQLIERVCKDYGLFEFDENDYISSPWLCQAMSEYDERKKKLQEAGRRGAAQRWGGANSQDSKPIASLNDIDSKPLAYDAIPYNVTQYDFTLPDTSKGKKVGTEFLEAICNTQPEGHASGYVAQVCLQYGMTEETHNFICEHSDNAKVDDPTFKRFCALVKRIQAEKWVPKHPDNFFIKKIFA